MTHGTRLAQKRCVITAALNRGVRDPPIPSVPANPRQATEASRAASKRAVANSHRLTHRCHDVHCAASFGGIRVRGAGRDGLMDSA